LVGYAQDKTASVRTLHRTSLGIPHAGGRYDPKPLTPILAGVLTFESDWSPPLGEPLEKALLAGVDTRALDIGCVASHGIFTRNGSGFQLIPEKKPATAFLLELTGVWLTLKESQLVSIIDGLSSSVILRKSLQNGHFLEEGQRKNLKQSVKGSVEGQTPLYDGDKDVD
jgi:hypothetical protein